MLVTTSNITAAIDLAFVDRAYIKQYVRLPSVQAIYKVYQSCILELKGVSKCVYNRFYSLRVLTSPINLVLV